MTDKKVYMPSREFVFDNILTLKIVKNMRRFSMHDFFKISNKRAFIFSEDVITDVNVELIRHVRYVVHHLGFATCTPSLHAFVRNGGYFDDMEKYVDSLGNLRMCLTSAEFKLKTSALAAKHVFNYNTVVSLSHKPISDAFVDMMESAIKAYEMFSNDDKSAEEYYQELISNGDYADWYLELFPLAKTMVEHAG